MYQLTYMRRPVSVATVTSPSRRSAVASSVHDSAASAALRPPGGREVNGRAAVWVLIYLGLSLQLLQVGIIPLLPQIGAATGPEPAPTSWLVTGSLLSGAVFLAVLSRLADLIGKKPVVLIALGLVL